MIHAAALLALACVQDPEELKLEILRLKEKVAQTEAYAELLRKRLTERPATPPPTAPTPPVIVPATPKERAEGILRSAAPAASRPIECKVSAVATEIDLLVLSAGKDAGVSIGDPFTVYRGGEFVAKVVIDRVDRTWSAGKVTLKKSDPRVGDEASNTVFVNVPRTAVPPPDELRALRKELDEVRKQVRALSDTLVPAWQGPGVALEEAPEELRAHLGIARGVLVRRVRAGSPAEKAGLRPNDLVPDLGEAEVVDALQNGKPIRLLRQGREVTTK